MSYSPWSCESFLDFGKRQSIGERDHQSISKKLKYRKVFSDFTKHLTNTSQMLIRYKQICVLRKEYIFFFFCKDNFGTGTHAHESLKDDPGRMMTLCRQFFPWLRVSATLTITQILWACQESLPSFLKYKIKFTSLSLSTHRCLICSRVLIVFSSPNATSLNLFKNNH